jgi:hypothetical protein
MSTQAQIIANQANAQKSTGPTTAEGKAASSQNRRSHGLRYTAGHFQVLPWEDQNEYHHLIMDLLEEYAPQTPSEHLLVHNMSQSQWLRDRALRLQERCCFDPETGEISDEKKFALYQRYFVTHDRAFQKCLATLLKQRKDRQNMEIGFEREKRNQSMQPLREMHKEMEINMLQIKESEAARQELREEFAGRQAGGDPTGQKAAA